MKKISLLSTLMLFVMAAFLPMNLKAQTNEIHVTSFGSYDFSGKHFCILSNMENISSDDIEFKEYAKYISYVFQMKGGIEVSPESDKVEVFILMSYDSKDASYIRTISEPVWGQTNVSSVTATPNRSGGVNYNYHYNYGVVDYVPSQQFVNSFNMYIDLFAYTATSVSTGHKLVWKAYVKSNGSDDNLYRTFPAMALASYEAIGETSEDVCESMNSLAFAVCVNSFKKGVLSESFVTYKPSVENGNKKISSSVFFGYADNTYRLVAIRKDSHGTNVYLEVSWRSFPSYWYWNDLWFKVPKNTYIRYRGKNYKCEYIRDLEDNSVPMGKICKKAYYNNGNAVIALHFPPLPDDAYNIDLLFQQKNKASEDDLIWRGIQLRNW